MCQKSSQYRISGGTVVGDYIKPWTYTYNVSPHELGPIMTHKHQFSDKSVKKCDKNHRNSEYREVSLYGGYTKSWTHTCNVSPQELETIMTYKYQFSDKYVKKCGKNNQITEYREVPLYGGYTKSWTYTCNVSPPELEPIMTNKYQFSDKSVKKGAKVIKVPSIGRYRYMGTITKRGPIYLIC